MKLDPDVRAALEGRARHRLASGVEVVDIYGSVGRGFMMALDGRLFEWNWDTDEHEITEAVQLRLALVAGSRAIPSLKRLIPQRPANAVDCAKCRGSGEASLNEEIKWLCNTCGGVGWTEAP